MANQPQIWFKNAMIYRLTKKLDWSLEALQTQLEQTAFSPCQQSDRAKFGWVPSLFESPLLYFYANGHLLLTAQKEEKILPASVIKRAFDERIETLEQKEQRTLKKTEKQSLKEDVIASLLPRAFSKFRHSRLWIDTFNQLIYVEAASAKSAEEILGLLRKTLGSLPVVPLRFALEPAVVMTDWIVKNELPSWLNALDDAELRGFDDMAMIRCKKQDLSKKEILHLLENQKYLSKLALEWEEILSFLLSEDGTLTRLKFADEVREKNDDILKEDVAQRFDADFLLMTETLSTLTKKLLQAFGGEKERLA